MSKDEKNGISAKLADFEEITVKEEPAQPVIEIAQQPEFDKIPKRFWTVPVYQLPLGYVKGKRYYDKFPFVKLPVQKIEEIKEVQEKETGFYLEVTTKNFSGFLAIYGNNVWNGKVNGK
jgi:hypothetical protein